jgi:hypothetical protein
VTADRIDGRREGAGRQRGARHAELGQIRLRNVAAAVAQLGRQVVVARQRRRCGIPVAPSPPRETAMRVHHDDLDNIHVTE